MGRVKLERLELKLETTEKLVETLDEMLDTGLYGRTLEDLVEGLLMKAARDFVLDRRRR